MHIAATFQAQHGHADGHAGFRVKPAVLNGLIGTGQNLELHIGRREFLTRSYEGANRQGRHGKHATLAQEVVDALAQGPQPPDPVIEGQRALGAPAHAHAVMVLQVFADTGQVVHDRDIETLQPFRIADTGQFEDLR